MAQKRTTLRSRAGAKLYAKRVSYPKPSSPMTSSIATNSDGTKTVTFQCGPR